MNNDVVALVLATTAVSSAALLIVLLLRRPLRAAFGARSAYGLWSLPPLAMIAALLPAPVHFSGSPTLGLVPASPLSAMVDVPATGSASTVWLAIWLLGTVAMMAWIGWQQRRFVCALGPLREVGDGCVQATVNAGLPALVGVLRTRIVLPADFATRYDADQQRLVIAHEREHPRRGDHLANLLAAIVRCLYWFNPLLVIALPLFWRDQELACDAGVLAAHPRQRRRYGAALLNSQCLRERLPLGCQGFGSHPLKERITMIQQHALSKFRIRLGRIAIVLLAGAVTAAAWALQPQPAASAETAADANASEAVSFRTQFPPIYPGASLKAREQGTVVLKVRVLADGTPSDIVIHKSTASPALEQAAIDAVQAWRFNPAAQNGRPVEGTVLVPVIFSLDNQVVTDKQALSGG